VSGITFGLENVRWTPIENHHITLNFLGDVKPNLLPDIIESLEEISVPAFELSLKKIDIFEHSGNGVIYLGTDTPKEIFSLNKKIFHSLNSLNLQLQNKKYIPHITLGRFKGTPQPDLLNYLKEFANYHTEKFLIDEYCLFSSQLKPTGPIYIEERNFILNN
jgi:2'-5' RNA ligase